MSDEEDRTTDEADRMRVPDSGSPAREPAPEVDDEGRPLTGYDRDGKPVYGDRVIEQDETGNGGDSPG